MEGSNGRIVNVRFETSASSTEALREMFNNWVVMRDMQNGMIENLYGFGNSAPLCAVVNVHATGDATEGTIIDNIASSYYSRLTVGDHIYLYEASTSDDDITDGDYVVESKDGLDHSGTTYQITLTTDAGDNDGDDGQTYMYLLTLADNTSPSNMVLLDNADNTTVRNVWGYGFKTSLVQVEADCQDATIQSVYEQKVNEYDTEDVERYWLYHCKPQDVVLNAGVRTTILNPQIYNAKYTGTGNALAYGGTNDGNANQTVGEGGIRIASAAALAVGSAYGPNFRVYVTGTTDITSITGGYLGQIITLIAVDAGFTVTDGAALNVGTGNVALATNESITLICDAAAGNSWHVCGIEAYP